MGLTVRNRVEKRKESNPSRMKDSMVYSEQLVGKFATTRTQAKNYKEQNQPTAPLFNIKPSQAYGNGYWLFPTTADFTNGNNLFADAIRNSLTQINDSIQVPLDEIINAVKPTDDDKKVLEMLNNKNNDIITTFQTFKQRIQQIIKALTKLNNKSDRSPNSTEDIISATTTQLVNAGILDGDIIKQELAKKMANPRFKKIAGHEEDIKEAYGQFAEMTKKIKAVLENQRLNTNQTYQNAYKAFSFVQDSNKGLDVILKDLTAGKTLSQKLGDYFELAFAAAYGGTIVATTNTKETATDVIIASNNAETAANNLEKAVNVSLKLSTRIMRTQDLDKIMNAVNNQIDSTILRPLRYFLANFTLLMESQNTPESGEIPAIPILSGTGVNALYEQVQRTLGQFLYTNLIVGFLMANGTLNNQQLNALPRIISTASGHHHLTHTLLQQVKDGADGDIMMDYTATLADEYLAFTDAQNQYRSQCTGMTAISAESFFEHRSDMQALYNSISQQIDKMKIWSAIDTSKIINILSNQTQ